MHADRLDATFAALADPTRRAMLARLAHGDLAVKDLAAPFHMSGPAITKHLKVLERAGLVARSREGRRRPCRLETAPLADASRWIEQYRRMWEARLDRLGDYLRALQADETATTSRAAGPASAAPTDSAANPRPRRTSSRAKGLPHARSRSKNRR